MSCEKGCSNTGNNKSLGSENKLQQQTALQDASLFKNSVFSNSVENSFRGTTTNNNMLPQSLN